MGKTRERTCQGSRVNVMDAHKYIECLEYVRQRDGLQVSDLRPALASDILTIERELDAQLPEQYEDFLRTCGVGKQFGGLSEWFHLDITRPGNLFEKNAELVAFQASLNGNGKKFPKGFLGVYDDFEGEIFGFLKPSGSRYLPQVVAWDQETQELSPVSQDFNCFLDYLADCDIEELELARGNNFLVGETFQSNKDIEDLFR